jgi:REP element-mobilizing transposase RayT
MLHLHCLLGLQAEMSIAKAIQLMKGESAFWINKQQLTRIKFEWANEYFAVSVSESMLSKVRAYIDKQEAHHSKKTFQQEYEEFISSYSFYSHG